MSSDVAVTLPRGLLDQSGGRHREAVLAPVTGQFELCLSESQELDPLAVSGLLAAAFRRIGGYDPIEPAHAAALTRGDRDFALLHLRRSIFGNRLALVVGCPNPSCRAEADLTLSITELAPTPAEPAPESWLVDTPDGVVTLREPTGDDDAAVHGLDAATASAQLWSRLVVDVAGAGPLDAERWSGLGPSTKHALALSLATRRVSPTLAFAAPCPSCRGWMEVELDPAALLASELGVALDRLFAEVHTLAYFYHWSERDILSLPRQRRWRYLELLARQTAGRHSSGGGA
jgi:hypothetical protein